MAHSRFMLAAAILALGVSLTACGGDDDGGATVASPTTSTSTPPESATAAGTVDANTATVDEMTAAFATAGISSPERWAREVEEYRPYPTDDPTFAKLRDELSKYNPGDEVLNKILSTLSL